MRAPGIVVLALALGIGFVPPEAVDARRAAPRVPIADPLVRDLVARVNARRRREGCRPLVWDERVAAVARAHSRDMVRRDFFSHVNPDGRNPFARLKAAGITYRAAAENIAYGQEDAEEVLEAWVRSPGHRRNLDDCDFTRHGIGRYRDRWTHVFLRP